MGVLIAVESRGCFCGFDVEGFGFGFGFVFCIDVCIDVCICVQSLGFLLQWCFYLTCTRLNYIQSNEVEKH